MNPETSPLDHAARQLREKDAEIADLQRKLHAQNGRVAELNAEADRIHSDRVRLADGKRAAERRLAACADALHKYGAHSERCWLVRHKGTCNCGLGEALRAAEAPEDSNAGGRERSEQQSQGTGVPARSGGQDRVSNPQSSGPPSVAPAPAKETPEAVQAPTLHRTWGRRSDGKWGCNECCNGDRCDDSTHVARRHCKACGGTGALRDDQVAQPSQAPEPDACTCEQIGTDLMPPGVVHWDGCPARPTSLLGDIVKRLRDAIATNRECELLRQLESEVHRGGA